MNYSSVLVVFFCILISAKSRRLYIKGFECREVKNGEDIQPGIKMRTFEVTISKQTGVTVKTDVFDLTDKCKGVIINTGTILSTAHCFKKSDSNLQQYRVYSGYLYVKTSEGLMINNITKVVIHPNYKENNIYNVAIITVESPYDFKRPDITGGLLPDNPLNFKSAFADRLNCDLTGFTKFANDTHVVKVIKLEAICNEDCRNRIKVLNSNISIARKDICIIQKNGSLLNPELLTEGTAIMVGKSVQGLIPHVNYTTWRSEYPVPIIDIGYTTQWIRTQLLNLRSGCFSRRINYNLLVSLSLSLLYISLRSV